MTADEVLTALALPAGARVDQRVPKKLLVENGAPTAADKRQITDGLDELRWVAALKPATVGVPAFKDEQRSYLELAVLAMTLRDPARVERLVTLVHRAIPYPVLLVHRLGERVGVSLAHIRWSQGEAGKTVVDGDVMEVEWEAGEVGETLRAFRDALALIRQPQSSLLAVYDGWMDAVVALRVSRITGMFGRAVSEAAAADRRAALGEWEQMEAEIARVRVAAAGVTQMSRQVELNLELKRLEMARAALRARL